MRKAVLHHTVKKVWIKLGTEWICLCQNHYREAETHICSHIIIFMVVLHFKILYKHTVDTGIAHYNNITQSQQGLLFDAVT